MIGTTLLRSVMCSCIALSLLISPSRAGADEAAAPNAGSSAPPDINVTKFDKESDKASIIQFYAKKLLALSPPPPGGSADREFCQQLGADLRDMKDISFIEPIAYGKTEGDPALRRHWKNCTDLRPKVFFSPFHDKTYYRDGPAVLYHANFLNEHPADLQYILLSEDVCTRDVPRSCVTPVYHIVYPSTCTLSRGFVGDGIYTDQNLKNYGLSSIFLYRGEIWVANLSHPDQHGSYLALYNWHSSGRNKSCGFGPTWSQPAQIPSPDQNRSPNK